MLSQGEQEQKQGNRGEFQLEFPSSSQLSCSPHLLLLIGLPGSGKSTLAQQLLAENSHRQLISPDVIRCQLFGDTAIQGPWLLIWREVQRQFQLARSKVSNCCEVIYDATNARRRSRREVIALARDNGFSRITGVWLDQPIWLCLGRNHRRDRSVPEPVILRMQRQLRQAPPTLAEGFDYLLHYSPQEVKTYGYCDRPVSKNRTLPGLCL